MTVDSKLGNTRVVKADQWEKVSLYIPDLKLDFPPPFNTMYCVVRSPLFLEPKRKKAKNPTVFNINRITISYYAKIFDLIGLYEIAKTITQNALSFYYKELEKQDVYKIPEDLEPSLEEATPGDVLKTYLSSAPKAKEKGKKT